MEEKWTPGDQPDFSLESKVYEYMMQNQLLEAGSHVIVGVSGGADSVCLLFLLYRFQHLFHMRITAVHVHHGIRGAGADHDARKTEQLCRSWQIPCLIIYEDVPAYAKRHRISEEEAGRILRYQILRRVRKEKNADVIAVAHHGDDSVETVLWNLIRGSGLAGLTGIEPKREDMIRPLLCCTRKEITACLEQKGISWCEDETNKMPIYTRNKIRGTIIPALKELNPQASRHILQTAEILGELRQWAEEEAFRFISRYGIREDGRVAIPAAVLKEQNRALRMQVCMAALSEINKASGDTKVLNNISRTHLLLVDGLLERAHGAAVQLPGGVCIRRRYDLLLFELSEDSSQTVFRRQQEKALFHIVNFPVEYKIPAGFLPRGTLSFRLLPADCGEKNPEKVYTKWFDYDKIKDTLSVRTRKSGDYIRIMPGYRKKTIKAFMIDEKIPAEYRDRMLLVAEGSHILWVAGHRVSEGCGVSEHTKTILQIQMRKEQEDEREGSGIIVRGTGGLEDP